MARILSLVFTATLCFFSFIPTIRAETRLELHKKAHQAFDSPRAHSSRVDSGGDTTSRHSSDRTSSPSQNKTVSGGDTTSRHNFSSEPSYCPAGTRKDFLSRCVSVSASNRSRDTQNEGRQRNVLFGFVLRALCVLLMLITLALVVVFLGALGSTVASLFFA